MLFDVRNKRVQQELTSRKRDNCFSGPGWEAFGNEIALEVGQRLVFTNLEQNRLSAVVIGGDGVGLTREEIYPVLIKRNPRKIQFRDLNGNELF